MERNTVLLDLGEYNELRDFFEGINGDKFVIIDHYDGNIYYKKESVVLFELKADINSLKRELYSCRHPEESEEKEIDFKKMSIWQFIKWKRKILIKS